MALTERQKRFVDEYLIDLNATQACIRAGYSAKNADKIGSQLLGKTRVSEHLHAELAKRSKRTGINQDRVVKELARIALVNPKNLINAKDASINKDANDDDLACIQSVKVKTMSNDSGDMVEREVKLHDKLKALELLGKHLGMWSDNSVSVTVPIVIKDNVPDSDD